MRTFIVLAEMFVNGTKTKFPIEFIEEAETGSRAIEHCMMAHYISEDGVLNGCNSIIKVCSDTITFKNAVGDFCKLIFSATPYELYTNDYLLITDDYLLITEYKED